MAAPLPSQQCVGSCSCKTPNRSVFLDFHELVKSKLGRKLGRSSEEIFYDISCVILGVKPGFLFDYTSLSTPSTLLPLCEAVVTVLHSRICHCSCRCQNDTHTVCTLLKNFRDCFGIYFVAGDVFIINVEVVVKFFKRLSVLEPCFGDTVLVADASFSLPMPKFATDSVYMDMKEMLESVTKKLLMKGFTTEADCTVETCKEWCIPSLFGLLIGYPVIYWLDTSDGNNCLSCVPLNVYKVTCMATDLKEFELKGDSCSDLAIKKHIIYSFSVPSNLENRCRSLVSNWFSNLQEIWKKTVPDCLMMNLRLEVSDVVLSSVAL